MYIPKSRIDGLLETYARCGVVLKSHQSNALKVMCHLGCKGWHPGKFNRIFRKVLLYLKVESDKAKMRADYDFAGIQEYIRAREREMFRSMAVPAELL